MKATDIAAITEIYAVAVISSSNISRSVVLDTRRWQAVKTYESGGTYRSATTGYRLDQGGSVSRGGLPVLAARGRYGEAALTDAELLTAAITARAQMGPDRVPDLPEGCSIVLVQSRAVLRPWAEHLAAQAVAAEASRERIAAQAAHNAAQDAARARIVAAIGADELLLRPNTWTELEALCARYLVAHYPAGPSS